MWRRTDAPPIAASITPSTCGSRPSRRRGAGQGEKRPVAKLADAVMEGGFAGCRSRATSARCSKPSIELAARLECGDCRYRHRCSEIVLIHWVGGVHTEIRLPTRRRGQRTSTSAVVIAAVRQLVLRALFCKTVECFPYFVTRPSTSILKTLRTTTPRQNGCCIAPID